MRFYLFCRGIYEHAFDFGLRNGIKERPELQYTYQLIAVDQTTWHVRHITDVSLPERFLGPAKLGDFFEVTLTPVNPPENVTRD